MQRTTTHRREEKAAPCSGTSPRFRSRSTSGRKVFILVCWFVLLGFSALSQEVPKKICGVNLVGSKVPIIENPFPKMKEKGINSVCFIPYLFVSKEISVPKIQYPHQYTPWGDRPENLRTLIRWARESGMHVGLKPHTYFEGKGWPGDFFGRGDHYRVFWNSYKYPVLDLARLAEEEKVDLFCVGVEFKALTTNQGPGLENWKRLIKSVRKEFSGKLTYAANWDNFQNISFWDLLDYVTIDAYFPLSPAKTPKAERMWQAWLGPIKAMKSIASKTGKPILLGEYGYRSTHYAAWQQWHLEKIDPAAKVNLKAQFESYAALYANIWARDWLVGGYIWRWHLQDSMPMINSEYSPQGKPVMDLIRKIYTASN